MPIHVKPDNFIPKYYEKDNIAPKTIDNLERDRINKQKTSVKIDGDIFQYRGVNFKPLTQKELIEEKIDISSLDLSSKSTTSNSQDNRVIIAFRDPEDKEKIIAYKLDKEAFEGLEKKFSSSDFFQREDGIVRLNKAAEQYVAGWVLEIKKNRGYEEADKNNDGFINDKEKGDLRVAFEHRTDYDYLDEKTINIRSIAGEKIYQKFSHTEESRRTDGTQNTIIKSQTLKFGNSVENELSHTLRLDENKDGTITLREGLEDYTPEDKTVDEHLAKSVYNSHMHWIYDDRLVKRTLPLNIVGIRDISPEQILSNKEREEANKKG